MKRVRLENALEIINYAIKHEISVKEASKISGFADTYLKNVKREVYGTSTKNKNVTEEQYNIFNDAYIKYINSSINKKNSFHTQSNQNNQRPSEPNKPKDIPKTGNRESFRQNGNDAEFEWVGGGNYPVDHIHTLPQLLGGANVNSKTWKVKDYLINKWDVTMKILEDGEWVAKTYQNWQVKARLERDIKFVKERIAGEVFQEMTKNYNPPVLHTNLKLKQGVDEDNNLLEISIFDLHIGKLAWGGETFENYDVKIARSRFMESIEKLLKGASGFNYNRILFPVGNDFFNSDTMVNTTTKGTPQDEDLRWQKTFDIGCRLLIDAINLLKQTGVPVDVVVIPGNHDFERSYYLGSVLNAWFNQDSAVNIDNHASPRKYYVFGNVLLGLTHGGEEKEASLPMLMATDVPSKPFWSETKFHEWHLGHIHRKRNVNYIVLDKSRSLNEDLGVTIRYLSSLTGTEEWHHKKGFVGSTKAADGFVWNHEFGLVAHLNTNLILE